MLWRSVGIAMGLKGERRVYKFSNRLVGRFCSDKHVLHIELHLHILCRT